MGRINFAFGGKKISFQFLTIAEDLSMLFIIGLIKYLTDTKEMEEFSYVGSSKGTLNKIFFFRFSDSPSTSIARFKSIFLYCSSNLLPLLFVQSIYNFTRFALYVINLRT